MKITALETFRPAFQPNLCVVRLEANSGKSGLGEAFFHSSTVETYLHDAVAPALLGTDVTPESAARLLTPYVGYQGGGAETRGNGAIDLALWDLLGHESNLPVVRLLGGPVRQSVRVYNTCAGSGYVGSSSRQESANWGLNRSASYEDLNAFLTDPGQLAQELRSEGLTGMKVWPFDTAAERTKGTEISPGELNAGLAVVSKIRDAVGSDLDIMVELHGLWNLPAARTIIGALTEYEPYWIEDPLRPDNIGGLRALRATTNAKIATGETLVGRQQFLPLLAEGLIDFATVDTQWTGGLTEARKVAALSDAFGVPVAPHDCTGPITLAACAHLTLSQPNGVLQETTRSFIRTWYGDIVEGLPQIRAGQLTLSERPGLGVNLVPGFEERSDVTRRRTLSKA